MRDQVRRSFPAFSEFQLESYVCGDATAEAARAIEHAAAQDPALSRHLAERRAERAAFMLSHPRLPEAAPARRPSRWQLTWIGAAALACASVLLVVVGPKEGALRAKGTALGAELVVQRGERTFVYGPGVWLKSGDRLRLRTRAAAPGFLT